MPKKPKTTDAQNDLIGDLQRLRADFENYRKRIETEKAAARSFGQRDMIKKLLPVIDDLERATGKVPPELANNNWAQGIVSLSKNLDKTLESIGISRIASNPGTPFNPDIHHAVQFDEDSEGESEVVAEQLQPGYMFDGQILREAMVKVKKQ